MALQRPREAAPEPRPIPGTGNRQRDAGGGASVAATGFILVATHPILPPSHRPSWRNSEPPERGPTGGAAGRRQRLDTTLQQWGGTPRATTSLKTSSVAPMYESH